MAFFMHPKNTWCFAGESFMKIAKKLLQTCSRANKPWNITNTFANKYGRALHYLFIKISDEHFV